MLITTSDPLPDPYLAIAEVIILVMAPIMVLLMLAIHERAPAHTKPFTGIALGWMIAAAATTMIVHFVELTVARHINQAAFPGYARIFDFRWPSTFYAIDIVAWDVFFALALLFAVPAFSSAVDGSALVRYQGARARWSATSAGWCPAVAYQRTATRPTSGVLVPSVGA